jgi:hypothetical protein
MASKTSSLWRSLRTYQIYGANTNVGKTIMSTILCKAFKRQFPSQNVWYLKPVSTGPLDEADDRHISRFSSETKTKCLFQFDEAVSPHIAARSSQVSPQLPKKTRISSRDSPCLTLRFVMKSSHTSQLVRKMERGQYCSRLLEVSILPLPVAVHKQTCTDLFGFPFAWLQTIV